MEPPRSWGPAQAAAWLRGLDAAVQGYPFEAWGLSGPELLRLEPGLLEALGVRPVGHQELLLEAVEQLRSLDTGLASTSLRTLTERLQELAQGIQGLMQGGLWAGDAPQPPSLTLLARAIELLGAAKELFSWLNRYLFSTLNDFSASQDIILLCAQLAETLQADLPAAQRSSGILQIVGWTPVSLARKLLEKGNRVTLVLKKIPLDLPSSPPSPRQQPPGAFLDAADSPGTRSGESPGSPVSLSSSVAADLDSGAESVPDPATDEEQEEAEREPGLPGAAVEERPGPAGQGAAEELWDSGTPLDTPLDTPAAPEPPGTELSPRAAGGAEPGPEQGSPSTARRPKGVATRLSRRRVSCRDLGRADCDGWLLKKKEHVGFMAQKWKRCWVVLKGHTLYWYNHPNDERAAGLINVATYNLESTREQKKKYVFQLCHQTYKPFVFAAETLADLSMWVSHLVTAKTKHTLAQQAVPDKEEDCYSETEAEDPDDEAPRHGSDPARKRLQNSQEKAQLSPGSSPQGSPRPCSPLDPGGEDLASLARCLRQGGLSLTGQRRALTQEQCRKSFLRRNRNPHINERVHAVRALQSTLKAKLAELQALEQLLGEAALTSDTFRRWKEEHQELYQELREGWAGQRGQGGAGEQHREAAEP
ncbi:connector enhancer of kinase suppressor of ras 1 isoform X1 [Zonotrichia leucophrys gambelii]|uniref:connector enhancer of kinase suppressor of ras 1 isoform X1 n=1 Tax=Zonotrichia leucophrys gambelii TaxID=257770 RepID=UPI00314024D0